MRRWRRTGLAGLLAGASAVAAGCGANEPAAVPIVRPVRVMTVVALDKARERSFSGVARAGSEATLSFRVSGTIDRLPVKVGDRVGAGALVARIDPVDYELRAKEAEAALLQARAQAGNAAADLRRVRGLYENDNASRDDLDAALAVAASAGAQVESLTRRHELALRQVGYTRLTAPVAGSIADVRVEVNENVGPGQAVALLASGSQPEVELAVPESLIARVAEGDAVRVRFAALADRAFPGVVTEVGVAATALATTFPVRVRLAGPAGDVRPGMAAEVTFTFARSADRAAVAVPPEAVGEDRTGRFVFVAEPAGDGLAVARRRPVTVGEFTPDGLEILSGLADGDRLITAGVTKIEDGTEVRASLER